MDIGDIVFRNSIYDTNATRTSRCCTFAINLSAGKIITDNFATCTKYRIIFCGWVVGCPSFFYFFFVKEYK